MPFIYGCLGDLQITAYLYVTSGTASVYFDDADNATCKSGLACRIPCCWSQNGLFSASAVNVREAHEHMRAIQPCNTHLYCIVVTSWHCVLHHKLAIKYMYGGV